MIYFIQQANSGNIKIGYTSKDDVNHGTLILAADGKWDIVIGGQVAPTNLHYTTDQVERIVATSKAAGDTVITD